MSLVLFTLSNISVFLLRTECQSLTFFSVMNFLDQHITLGYHFFKCCTDKTKWDNIFKQADHKCMLFAPCKLCKCFDLMSCQPNKALDTHSDVENGFSLHAKTLPKTFNDNNYLLNSLRPTWNSPCSGIMLMTGFHPLIQSSF